MNRIAFVLVGLRILHAPAGAETGDQRAVRELETGVALVLTRQGFDAYAARFHPDYSNWTGRGAPIGRAEFLASVKAWHGAGNHAVAVAMQPISFEVFGDVGARGGACSWTNPPRSGLVQQVAPSLFS